MIDILQKIYDSEINFKIETFWDGGFDVGIGDSMNGFDAETNTRKISDAIEFLKQKALEHYPESDFAKEFK